MACGIYKITNLLNDKCYIGQSLNIQRRWSEHRRHYKYNDSKLYYSIRKYGIDNFEFSIVEECLPEELDEREKYWILFYDSINKGYNAVLIPQNSSKRICILSEDNFLKLINEIKNTNIPFSELAEKYGITEGYIYQINKGSHRHRNFDYPLRKLQNKENSKLLTNEQINSILEDLKSYSYSFKEISTISSINAGLSIRTEGVVYPIRPIKRRTKRDKIQKV